MSTKGPATREQISFGALLKRFRLAAGLSQEALAERARLSVGAISAYERELRQAPFRDTVRLLIHGLDLSAMEAAALEAAVPRRRGHAGPPCATTTDAPSAPAADPPTGTSTFLSTEIVDSTTRWEQHPAAITRHDALIDTALTRFSSPQAPKTNLPVQVTSFVGRERELAAVLDLLDHSRLVTLTGAAGSGKTRLAVQVATELLGEFPDGIFLVALAPIADPGLVAGAIAQTLGVREAEGRPFADNLKGYLRERRMLLVLDNFEQVVVAAPLVAELLSQCPRLRILVTSRATLHLRGEQEYAVPPLALPDPHVLPPVESLMRYAAVALFIQRTVNVRADFQVTNDNAQAVAEICRRLDGLPLPIELAAARGKLLSPEALLARLEHRLTLLTGGARDLPARQRTLRDAIAWSYDLLDVGEQRLFRRLSVFVGGCGLEEAEAVCNTDDDLGVDMLNGVTILMDNSLLWRQASVGVPIYASESEPRLTMLETIREYGLECLEASGEVGRTRQHHASMFLRLAEEAEAKLQGVEAKTWLSRLDAEHDNLRAALAWSLGSGEMDIGLRLAAALGEFWYRMGYLSEGRGWIERALSHLEQLHPLEAVSIESPATGPQSPWRRDVAARLHESHGDILVVIGQPDVARDAYRQALVEAASSDSPRQGRLHRKIATAWRSQQAHAQAAPAYDLAEEVLGREPSQGTQAWRQEWIDIQRDRMGMWYELGEWSKIAALRARTVPIAQAAGTPTQRAAFSSYLDLGVEFRRSRYLISNEMLAASRAELTVWQEIGDVRALAEAQFGLGFCLLWRGALDEAETQFRAALATIEPVNAPTDHARFLTYLAILLRKRGQVEEVRRLGGQSLTLAIRGEFAWYIGAGKANLAWVSWREGNFDEARSYGDAAMDIWRGSAYPFQWTALWPLLALALTRGAPAEALDHARALLAPPQQLLPPVLATALEEAILAEEGGQLAAARTSLERAVELARESRFL